MGYNSDKEYANSIYDSMAECGQQLAKEQKEREKMTGKAIDPWNAALEQAAVKLKEWYPNHASTNAYCAAVRSLKK